jgi:hypothetical protein
MTLTKEEKINFLNHRVLFYKSCLDLEKEDLSALRSLGSNKVSEVELDIENKQKIIKTLEDTLNLLTIGS